MKKLRVGVFMGGKSIEREVSFNSGRTVCDHLDTARYEIIPIFQTSPGNLFILPWHFLHRGKITDFEHRLEDEAECIAWDDLKNIIDFMYIAVHGRYAEDGTLQGFLEVLGIPYLGSKLFASAVGMDKTIQKDILGMHGIDVPNGITISPHELKTIKIESLIEKLEAQNISLPLIIKPHKEGSSLGVSAVFDYKKLKTAINTAATIHSGETQSVLIEEKIEGMEFSCITITDYKTGKLIPLPPTEVIYSQGTHLHDYEQKYMPGKSTERTPPHCDKKLIKKIQDVCVQATKALGITNISRIDGFLTKNKRVVVIDPNTLSGMGPASFLFREAAEYGMNHTHLINHLIETELENYGMLEAIIAAEQQESFDTTSKARHSGQAEKGTMKKLRVAVLCGGASNEKEISLESGRNIVYKLSPHTYEALPIFVTSNMELYKLSPRLLVRNSTKEIESLVEPHDKIAWNDLPTIADFVFIGLHGGAGENGAVQGTLEMLGLPYNGSGVLASSLCINKYKTNQFLQSKGFSVPQSALISKDMWQSNNNPLIQRAKPTTQGERVKEKIIKKITSKLSLPLVIKPHDDGCSTMVKFIKKEKDITDALNEIFKEKEFALIEECIQGMELTVGVIGNEEPRALPPSKAVSTGDILSIEEKFLPGAGENQTPAPLPQATLQFVQQEVVAAYKALGCKGYARIDCFYQDIKQSSTKKEPYSAKATKGLGRVVFIEVNTLPGMTPATCIFHQAAELSIRPMDFINMIIQYGLKAHQTMAPAIEKAKQKAA